MTRLKSLGTIPEDNLVGELLVFVLKGEVHFGTENLHDPWSYHHQQSPHPCHPSNQPLPPKKEAGPTVPSTCLSPICFMTSMHFCHFKACPTASTNAPKPRKDNGVANGDNGIRTAALLHLSSLVVAGGQVVKEVKGFISPQ